MARVPELTPDSADDALRTIMQSQEEMFGFVLNPTRVMGHVPGVVAASARLGQAIDDGGNLEDSLRYLVYSKVAALNGCPF